jgi:hypothetical protein
MYRPRWLTLHLAISSLVTSFGYKFMATGPAFPFDYGMAIDYGIIG